MVLAHEIFCNKKDPKMGKQELKNESFFFFSPLSLSPILLFSLSLPPFSVDFPHNF